MIGYTNAIYTAPDQTAEIPDHNGRLFMPTMEELLMVAIVLVLFFMRKSLNAAAYSAALIALVALYIYKRVQKVEKYCAKCMA